jgi:NADPH-dependent ferric siderophore reductase
MVLAEVAVAAVRRLSPSYVRVELGGPGLADFGVAGPLYDQRIKLLFPAADGRLPAVADADGSWLAGWRALPEERRGHLRTYTVRDVRGAGPDTRLVVDLVLHLAPGSSGPGARWAARARVGDRIVVLAPRRGVPFGGIEFAPGDARALLLAGDETAVPALCRILEDLPAHAVGAAFLEVPEAGDVQRVDHPAGVRVVWLPRDRDEVGTRLQAAVLSHLGTAPAPHALDVPPAEVDPDLWETPTYSSSHEEVDAPAAAAAEGTPVRAGGDGDAAPLAGVYAWIAGESAAVTGLRRHLVRELGMDRRRVAFMGYWRRGVAARS